MTNHFFDIGANVGQTFDDYLLQKPEYDGWDVWCFEPSPRHIPALLERTAALKDRYQIHVCPFGLSDRTGTAEFFQKNDPRGDSFESYLASGDNVTSNLETGVRLTVIQMNVVEFIAANIPPEDKIWLKLDCEGSEYRILTAILAGIEGDLSTRFSGAQVEWHNIGQLVGGIMGTAELKGAYEARNLVLGRWGF